MLVVVVSAGHYCKSAECLCSGRKESRGGGEGEGGWASSENGLTVKDDVEGINHRHHCHPFLYNEHNTKFSPPFASLWKNPHPKIKQAAGLHPPVIRYGLNVSDTFHFEIN